MQCCSDFSGSLCLKSFGFKLAIKKLILLVLMSVVNPCIVCCKETSGCMFILYSWLKTILGKKRNIAELKDVHKEFKDAYMNFIYEDNIDRNESFETATLKMIHCVLNEPGNEFLVPYFKNTIVCAWYKRAHLSRMNILQLVPRTCTLAVQLQNKTIKGFFSAHNSC